MYLAYLPVSICLPIHLSINQSIYLSIHLSISPSVYILLSTHLSIYAILLSICLSTCLSIYAIPLSICLSICALPYPICLSVYLSITRYVRLSVSQLNFQKLELGISAINVELSACNISSEEREHYNTTTGTNNCNLLSMNVVTTALCYSAAVFRAVSDCSWEITENLKQKFGDVFSL